MFHFSKLKLTVLLLVGALLASVVSYAANAASGRVEITTSGLPNVAATGGSFAKVTGLSGTFARPTDGRADKIAGVPLFKVVFANPAESGQSAIQLMWLDPSDATKELHNPHAFIEVRAYYAATSTAACPEDYRTVGTSATVCPATARDGFGELHLTQERANGILEPTQTNQDTLYILADITTGEGVAPGQQDQLNGLQFWATANPM